MYEFAFECELEREGDVEPLVMGAEEEDGDAGERFPAPRRRESPDCAEAILVGASSSWVGGGWAGLTGRAGGAAGPPRISQACVRRGLGRGATFLLPASTSTAYLPLNRNVSGEINYYWKHG
jgi:hypothetical protein